MVSSNFVANFNLVSWANAQAQLNSGNPMNVTIPMMDNNGNIVNVAVPNRGMFQQRVWDDVGGALGQFNRTLYVDAVNGDDNNDGSESSPFQTIKKAVDSVPVSGIGTIRLESNQIFEITEDIKCDRKGINVYPKASFSGYGDFGNDSRPIIKFVESTDGTHRKIPHFSFYESYLKISGPHIHIPASSDSNLNTYTFHRSIFNFGTNTTSFLTLARGTIKNESDYFLVAGWEPYPGQLHFSTYEEKYIINSTHAVQIRLDDYGAASLTYRTGSCSIVDENDSSYNFTDIISNVIRDSNGIPRNIISNIVF